MSDTPYQRRAFSKWACSLALAGFAVTAAAEVTDEQFEYSFHPYKQGGFPQVGGIKEGMTINASNIDLVKDYIDPGNYKLIKDGWWEMKVGPTYDYELHPLYIAASKVNKNIGIENGNLTNFVSGRPFPYKPDIKDPLAGEKLLWNFQYGSSWGDMGCLQIGRASCRERVYSSV